MWQEVRELPKSYVSERCSLLDRIGAAWGRPIRKAGAARLRRRSHAYARKGCSKDERCRLLLGTS